MPGYKSPVCRRGLDPLGSSLLLLFFIAFSFPGAQQAPGSLFPEPVVTDAEAGEESATAMRFRIMDQRIASAMVQELLAGSEGDFTLDQAHEFLNTAQEYDPRNSDVLYLRALLAAPSSPATSLDLIEAALTAKRFVHISRDQAELFLMYLLTRLGEYARLTDLYLSGSISRSLEAQPDAMLYLIDAMLKTGYFSRGLELLERMEHRYPEYVGFRALEIGWKPQPMISDYPWLSSRAADAHTALLPLVPENFSLEWLVNPWVPRLRGPVEKARLVYLLGMEEGSQRDALLERYLASVDHADPAAWYLDLARQDYQARETAFSRMLRNAGGDYLVRILASQLQYARSGLGEELLADSLDGSLHADLNRDGLNEWQLLYRAGELELLQIDADQDGVFEQEYYFDSEESGIRVPMKAVLRADGRRLELNFGLYPALSTAVLTIERGMLIEEVQYYLQRSSIELRPFQAGDAPDAGAEGDFLESFQKAFTTGLEAGSIPLFGETGVQFTLSDEAPVLDDLLEDLDSSVYLVETRVRDLHGGGFRQVNQTRFDGESMLVSRRDEGGDGFFEQLSYFQDGVLLYILRRDDDGLSMLSVFDDRGTLVSQQLYGRDEQHRLPGILLSFYGSDLWTMPR